MERYAENQSSTEPTFADWKLGYRINQPASSENKKAKSPRGFKYNLLLKPTQHYR